MNCGAGTGVSFGRGELIGFVDVIDCGYKVSGYIVKVQRSVSG